jgi:hypothetical protein
VCLGYFAIIASYNASQVTLRFNTYWVALFLVPFPVVLTSIPLATLPSALIDLSGVPAEQLQVIGGCASLLLGAA